MATAYGVADNPLFVQTLKNYETIQKAIEITNAVLGEDEMTVSKEYVKGRGNIYSNPAIADYNRTRESANKTIATLLKILREFGADNLKGDIEDPLLALINEE